MEKSVDYIESNIKENLTAQMIAEYSGYSLYHFGRIFLAYYGMSVMEYVLKRRLSLAMHHVYNGAKIIDAALLYGFETASGFSKAFRRFYQCSPTQYLQDYQSYQEHALISEAGVSKDILEKNVRFEQKGDFKVIGFSTQPMTMNTDNKEEMVAAWYDVEHDGPETYLYETLDPSKHGEVGIFISDEEGESRYILGVIMDSFEKAEMGMTCLEIPEATYAVFTTVPFDESANPGMFAQNIRKTWKGIFENWLSNNDFIYDFEKLDFEYYDERCHSDVDAVMEIWIPIKEKSTKS